MTSRKDIWREQYGKAVSLAGYRRGRRGVRWPGTVLPLLLGKDIWKRCEDEGVPGSEEGPGTLQLFAAGYFDGRDKLEG